MDIFLKLMSQIKELFGERRVPVPVKKACGA